MKVLSKIFLLNGPTILHCHRYHFYQAPLMTGLASESSVGIRSPGRDGGGGGISLWRWHTYSSYGCEGAFKATTTTKTTRWFKTKIVILQAFLFNALHDWDVKRPSFTFGGPKHKKSVFFFFFWTYIHSFRLQLQKHSPTFDKLNERHGILKNGEICNKRRTFKGYFGYLGEKNVGYLPCRRAMFTAIENW